MKIKTKLAVEVIILVSLVSMVSFIALINTKQVQDTFVDFSSETMPILGTLEDMRTSTTHLTSTTMQIVLIEDESRQATGDSLSKMEEDLEMQFYQIENTKSQFNNAYSNYAALMNSNFPSQIEHVDEIAEKWNNLLLISNTMIVMKTAGAAGNEILDLKDDFNFAHQEMNQVLDRGVIITASDVGNREQLVDSLVNNTTMTILISLNLFIAAALGIRYLILKSISKPLMSLRKSADSIAKGNFVKTSLKGNDEITELGNDIDIMSGELEKLNDEIVKTERLSSIGNLASRLAHDLRNPLSVIKNSLEIMRVKLDPIMDEKTSLQMARVGRAVDRMTHQIDDVLDYVNVSELQLEPHSLSTVIESAILNTNIPNHIKVTPPNSSSTVVCDAYKLEIVISNILNNAVQALDGDGEISVSVKDQKDEAIIEITDSGPGIPADVMPKIFEPLFTTKQIGTGLGLASCKSIIEKHGGSIYVHNNPTRFTIFLPKEVKSQKESTEFDKISVDESTEIHQLEVKSTKS